MRPQFLQSARLLPASAAFAILAILALTGCATPTADIAPAVMAEPAAAPPPLSRDTAAKANPSPCEDDDGIGGTGCPVR